MKLIKQLTLAIIATVGLTTTSAMAQNPNFADGDLVLFFQNPGGTVGSDQTLYVNLGSATIYRGAAAGPDVSNLLNIIDISGALSTAFGVGWASETTLYAGLAAAANSQDFAIAINGDPLATSYLSKARSDIGTVGSRNSTQITLPNSSQVGITASNIIQMNTPFENASGLIVQLSTSSSNIDNQNPFSIPGVQGTAFGTIGGGVQQAGSASSFGMFGPVANGEFLLDLNRVTNQAATGEVPGGIPQQGTYEGTFVVGSDGFVSFVNVIPEPSSVLMLGLGGAFLAFVRRRRK